MSSLADKNLSQAAQDKISDITSQAQSGKISWSEANKQANAVRASEGANYTVSAGGTTNYNDGSTISSYKTGSQVSGGGSAQKTVSQYGGSSGGGSQTSAATTPQNTQTYNGITYTQQQGAGLYGAPVLNSDVKNYTQGGVTYQTGPSMARVTDPNIIQNGYYISNGYTVFVDENGYATKAVKGVADYTPHLDTNAANGTYNQSGAWTDNEMLTDADKQQISNIRAQLQAGQITGDQANAAANAIRAKYGYSIDKNGYVTDNGALSAVNDRRQQLGLTVNPESGSTAYYRYLMGTDTSPTAQAAGQVKTYQQFAQENGFDVAAPTGTNGSVSTVQTIPLPGNSAASGVGGVVGADTSGSGNMSPGVSDIYTPGNMGDYLNQWYQNAQQQQQNTIDFGTNQAILELIRNQQDAASQYQEQRNQIAIDEAKAKDNQALYAESRGDKGGIGAAQYDAIMNTAAQNRLAVNSAQTKLATDTSRQIADLRAQGEYEKADALLTLSQQYLSQLMSLEQWAAEYNLSVAQFNASLQQWQAEYDLKVADLMGSYNGQPTLSAQQFAFNQQQYADSMKSAQDEKLASAGEILLAAGIMPSASQLSAMGMTATEAQSYITAQKVAAAAKAKSSSTGSTPKTADIEGLFTAAMDQPESTRWTWVKQNYENYGLTSQPDKSDFEAFVSENTYDIDEVSSTAKAWYTDLYKLYSSQQDRLSAIEKEYKNGQSWMTKDDYLYLLDRLGLL